MSKEPVRACVTCRHMQWVYHSNFWKVSQIMGCLAVGGGCGTERRSGLACGPEGKLWEDEAKACVTGYETR